MRPLLLVLLLLAGAGAGCLGTVDPDAARSDQPQVLPWGLTDCTALVWFVPADAGAVAAQLPPGFAPRGVIGLPAGDPPPGVDAYLGFEAFTCQQGAGLEGPVQDMTYATVFTSVAPPAELAVDGVDGQHYYKWHVLVPDAARRAVLQQAGVPAVDGTVSLTEDAPGLWSASFELAGIGTFSLTGAAQGPPQASDATIPFAEFTPATGGFATWQATTANLSRAAGTGTWSVPAGSWHADVLGAEQGVATFDLDLWSFTEASITLPPVRSAG